MSITEPNIDAAFREYADLQFLRHQMLIDGKGDTAELAHTEDRMDRLWPDLDESQRRSLNGMASDLNWLRRNGEPPPNGHHLSGEAMEGEALSAALTSQRWHAALHYLRVCAPTVDRANLALLRGKAYVAMSLPCYGKAFIDRAADFAAVNGNGTPRDAATDHCTSES